MNPDLAETLPSITSKRTTPSRPGSTRPHTTAVIEQSQQLQVCALRTGSGGGKVRSREALGSDIARRPIVWPAKDLASDSVEDEAAGGVERADLSGRGSEDSEKEVGEEEEEEWVAWETVALLWTDHAPCFVFLLSSYLDRWFGKIGVDLICFERHCVWRRRTVNPEEFVLESDPAFGNTHLGPETYVPGPRRYRHIRHPSPEGLAESCQLQP
ncbi:hypothetical protein NL676_010722 [Syzygium grande]|nr:hypothetical protein NL676_010722 [Syzygium grande]